MIRKIMQWFGIGTIKATRDILLATFHVFGMLHFVKSCWPLASIRVLKTCLHIIMGLSVILNRYKARTKRD